MRLIKYFLLALVLGFIGNAVMGGFRTDYSEGKCLTQLSWNPTYGHLAKIRRVYDNASLYVIKFRGDPQERLIYGSVIKGQYQTVPCLYNAEE